MTEHQQKLCDIFSDLSNRKSNTPISLETKVRDLKFDSLDVLDLLMKINNEFGVDIPIEKFMLCDDIASVYSELTNTENGD